MLSIKIELHRFYLNLNPVKAALLWVSMWVSWQMRYNLKIRSIKMFKSNNPLKFIHHKSSIHPKRTKKVKMNTMRQLRKEGKKLCFSKTKFLKSIMKIFLTWVVSVVKALPNFVKKMLITTLSKDKDKKIWDWERNFNFSTLTFLTSVQLIKD